MQSESFFVRIGVAVLGGVAFFLLKRTEASSFVSVFLAAAIVFTVVWLNRLYDKKQITKEAAENGWMRVTITSTPKYGGRRLSYTEWYSYSYYDVAYRDRNGKQHCAYCRIDWKGELDWLYTNEPA
jgi:hypothetical protein